MTTNYWNLNEGEVERAQAVVVEWGSQENEETVEALITAWRRLTTTETTDRASGRAEQLERDLNTANASLAEWRGRYRDDILKTSKERDAALNQVVALERENAAVRRELDAVKAELASCDTSDEEGPSRAERQLTAKMRVLIDEHLGKRTPRRIRDIAEGNFPEDRTREEEEEAYRNRGRRSRRHGRGRYARRDEDTNPTLGW